MPQMDRRNMMMMAGLGFLAATIPVAQAQAAPADLAPQPEQPPPSGSSQAYIFQDEFDGPLGAGPDPAKWTVQTWQDDVYPPVAGAVPQRSQQRLPRRQLEPRPARHQ